ncbi:MAG UNVERIFIED_CONTAM: ABC transporter permease [Anaerolineae bacterium]|jgi:simple sugar transport system permease protein
MTGFKLTRLQFFGLFFIVVGLILVTQVPARIASDAMSGINLGDNAARLFNQPRVTVNVPTVGYSVVVGIVYVLVGASSFLNWAGLVRYRNTLLVVCGGLLIPTILLITAANNSFNLAIMLRASLRLSTPIIMGAMAGIWCERSGVVNIAIEGMMLIGAGIGFVMFTLSLGTNLDIRQAQWLGVLSAVLAGGLMAVLHAWLSITYKTDQIVSGTVINILAVGLTSFLRREVLISSEAGRETLAAVNLPLLKDIPILGEAIFQGQPIFYMMLLIVVFTHIMLYYTQWGLRTRAVGENPHAADTLGIHVQRNRWINVLIGGMISRLGGGVVLARNNGQFR